MTQNPESTQFGEKTVTPEEKTGLVRGVFDSVADQYDVMNDFMSGGIHRAWKNRLIRMIRPKAGQSFLDVAGGTGDIAFRIKNAIEKKMTDSARPRACAHDGQEPTSALARGSIVLCDLNWDMLRVGRNRAVDRGWLNDFDWITGNAETLPLQEAQYDVYTISFGLRNVTNR